MSSAGNNSVTHRLISEDEAGQRLDNFLIRVCKGVPKSHIYRILRSGEVRVNSKRVDATYRLLTGDKLRIPPIRIAERPQDEVEEAAKARVDLPILFEDDALLVIDKPEGIAVHGGSGVSFGVIEALRRQRPQAKFLELAHRLDRETSGILLVGKKRLALSALHDMFREHGAGADKRYLVLVKGRWMNNTQHVKTPLLKYLTDSGERRVSVHADGKPSHTVFRLLARWPEMSLLEAQLKTGRTHQIRVHLAHLGFPILGDEKYGDFALNKHLRPAGLKRMALHAWRMSFRHPISGVAMHCQANLPNGMADYIAAVNRENTREFASEQFPEVFEQS
ncbi:RluA family pseudouridine synthase [Dechloromonas sp.]|uniref:RluA family pseudouridine synthase n=1 Tax=Dechloromonas sp. TaxID=1917218 RepID=UPI001206D3A5|nr:RluA family pseudouridine synthase [Dechloromonas sp.]MBU3697104.1 RluA family pseudouridine synthase [Dechloromonas sp.]TEX49100.1 MAG: RNA pseudouridine synthase [Rhodocyclaceae bacterium]